MRCVPDWYRHGVRFRKPTTPTPPQWRPPTEGPRAIPRQAAGALVELSETSEATLNPFIGFPSRKPKRKAAQLHPSQTNQRGWKANGLIQRPDVQCAASLGHSEFAPLEYSHIAETRAVKVAVWHRPRHGTGYQWIRRRLATGHDPCSFPATIAALNLNHRVPMLISTLRPEGAVPSAGWPDQVLSNMEMSLNAGVRWEVLPSRSPGVGLSVDDGPSGPSAQAEGGPWVPLNPDCRP